MSSLNRPAIRSLLVRRNREGSAAGCAVEPLEARALLSTAYVIHISVDGLRSDAITSLGESAAPNFYRLRAEGAFTDNARNDYDYGETLPNHTDEITARPVLGTYGHDVTFNSDPGTTIHTLGNGYVSSVYDVAYDNGRTTAMYAGKEKFAFFDRSWPDEIGTYVYNGSSSSLTSAFVSDMATDPYNYSLLHLIDPDAVGHASGWMSDQYLTAVKKVDGLLGQVLNLVESDSTLQGQTTIVLTADHGGFGTGHADATSPYVYTIPFYAWGPDVAAGADLYALNADSRVDPGTGRLGNEASPPPIHHGDAANLALDLLGLESIPGSLFNAGQDLRLGNASLPTASADSYGTAEDTGLSVDAPGVLANDSDPGGNDLTAVPVSAPLHGSLTLNPDGSFAYSPAGDFAGTDTFTYRAYNGTAYSSPAAVTITVSPVNDPPVAVADSYTTAEGTPLVIAAPGVLQNDSDVEGPVTAQLQTGTTNGTLEFNANGSFTYTPDAGFAGEDSFSYMASDGQLSSGIVTASIRVAPAHTAYARADLPSNGTLVAGDFTATNASDDSHEALREVLVTLPNKKKTSRLEHGWTFDVYPGSSVTFAVEAHRTVNTENDNFVFAYSTDGATFTDMLTVTATADSVQSYSLPADTSGIVTVRVRDTSQVANAVNLDILYVDQMSIRTVDPQTPPPVVSIAPVDAAAAEAGSDPAEFSVSRSGDLAQALDVPIVFTGSAAAGDYTLDGVTTGTDGTLYVRLGAGAESTTFSVIPIDDTEVEGAEEVIATLQSGVGYELGAASASVTIADNDGPAMPPAAPTNLVGTAVSSTQINLEWTDNSGDEDGFVIEWWDGSQYVEWARVGANVTACQATGLTPGTSYSFRVRAVIGDLASDPSNVVKLRTPRR